MRFDEALKHMKNGFKMKLPSWGGFWEWNAEKQTIMINTKSGEIIDIRETENVEYTITNILSDEWEFATSENTEILGGLCTFGFDQAIKYVKRGFKLKRKGWNGKNQYIELAQNISYTNTCGDIENCEHEDIGNKAIAFVGTSGIQLGWLASQADMLAEDWTFAE